MWVGSVGRPESRPAAQAPPREVDLVPLEPLVTESVGSNALSNVVPLELEKRDPSGPRGRTQQQQLRPPPAEDPEAGAAPALSEVLEGSERGPWRLLAFTLPTLGIWLVNPVLSMIDTSVVGTRSATELAALGPGTTLCDSTAYLFTFLAVATTNMLAVSLARRDRAQAEKTLSDALVVAATLGAALGLGMYLAAPAVLARMTGAASAAAMAPALSYVRIRCWGQPAALITFVAQAFFLAAHDPWTPLQAAVLAGLTNLVGDVTLCCVFNYGIAGAAWATAFAQIVTAASLLLALRRPMRRKSLLPSVLVQYRWRVPSLAALRRFQTYAGPIVGVLLTKVIMYGVLSSTATHLGEVYAGAHHCMLCLYFLFAPMGDAVSQSAQTFLPHSIGNPPAAALLGRQLMATGFIVGGVNCAIASLLVLAVPGLLTNSAAVRSTMAMLTPAFCAALLVHTASMATEGMLLAGKDLVYMMLSYGVNLALTLGSIAYLTGAPGRLTIAGVWMCLLQFQGTRLIFNSIRLRQASSPLRTERQLAGMAPA